MVSLSVWTDCVAENIDCVVATGTAVKRVNIDNLILPNVPGRQREEIQHRFALGIGYGTKGNNNNEGQ